MRKSLIITAIVVVVLALLAGGGWFARRPLGAFAVERVLAWRGIEAELTFAELGPGGAAIENLRLGETHAPGVTARRIDVEYALVELLGGRVRAVRADGLQVRARLGEDGLTLAGVPLRRGGGDGGANPPPRIEATGAMVFLETTAGELVADADIAGDPESGWRVLATAYPAGLAQGPSALSLEAGEFEAVLGPDAATARLVLAIAEVVSPDVHLGAARVEADFVGAMGDPADITSLRGSGQAHASVVAGGIDADLAAAWVDDLLPDFEGVSRDLSAAHMEALREVLAAALGMLDVDFATTFDVADGRIALRAGDAVTVTASSGATVVLETPNAGLIEIDPTGGLVTARGVALRIEGEGAPNAIVRVQDAVGSFGAGRSRDWRATGAGRLSYWQASGFGVALDVSDARIEQVDDWFNLSASGFLAVDGERLGVSAQTARLNFGVDVTRENDAFVAMTRPGERLEFSAGRLSTSTGELRNVALAIEPAAGGEPLVASGRSGAILAARIVDLDAASPVGDGAVRLRAPAVDTRLEARSNAPLTASLRAQGSRLDGTLAVTGPLHAESSILSVTATVGRDTEFTARFESAAVEGDDLPAAISDMAGEIDAVIRDGVIERGRFAVAHARARHPAEIEIFAPFVFDATGRIADGELTGSSSAAYADGGPSAGAFEFLHDMSSGAGEATFETPRYAFTPSGLQPATLWPVLRGFMGNVRGEAHVTGEAFWGEEGGVVGVALDLDDTDFETRIGLVEGLNTRFAIADLLALETDGAQDVTVDLFNPGLELTDGVLSIALTGGGGARVERAVFPFAGGEISLEPMDWLVGGADQTGAFALRNVVLEDLVAMFNAPGLAVTGVVSGAAPFRVRERTITVEDGRLTANGPGEIRYVGEAADAIAQNNESSRIAFEALRHLEYESLELTLNGDLTGSMDLGVHAVGRSSEIYGGGVDGGVLVNFNSNFNGEFLSLLRDGMSVMDPLDMVREAIEE